MNIEVADLKNEGGFADVSKDNKWAINLSDVYWDNLITLIDQKKCIPFIGPGASSFQKEDGEPWLPLGRQIH